MKFRPELFTRRYSSFLTATMQCRHEGWTTWTTWRHRSCGMHPVSAANNVIFMFPPGRVSRVPSRHSLGILPVALASLLDRFEGIPALHLDPNQWEHPPESIVMGGLPSVREYFEAVFRDGTSTVVRPLKVVIIGKETVGKTRYEITISSALHLFFTRNRYSGIMLPPFAHPSSNPIHKSRNDRAVWTWLCCESESVAWQNIASKTLEPCPSGTRLRTNTHFHSRGTAGSIFSSASEQPCCFHKKKSLEVTSRLDEIRTGRYRLKISPWTGRCGH